jgi:hypothetical protein
MRGTLEHAGLLVRLPLVVHERIGFWARQIRPRVVDRPVRLIESRSAPDLLAAVACSSCPILLIDLADRPAAHLDHLDRALQAAPDCLSLVLERTTDPEIHDLAIEMGATAVLPPGTTPPVVVNLLLRWIPLAQRRAERNGWTRDLAPPADPIAALLTALDPAKADRP